MIARVWRGVTKGADAEPYLAYLTETGLAEYRATPGNRGVFALRRVVDDRAEFVLLTLWDSEEAVRRFAGANPSRAVFYPEDDRFLIERGELVDHFDVVFSSFD
jgi:heme-degrading monooxygenase HmoA